MHPFRLTILRAALATALFVAVWIGLTLAFHGLGVGDSIGWAIVYLLGLTWLIFLVERAVHRIERRRLVRGTSATGWRAWNPIDPTARYYGFWVSVGCFSVFSTAAVLALLGALLPSNIVAASINGGQLAEIAVASAIIAMAALAAAAAQSHRLRQSLAILSSYSIVFVLVYVLIHWQFTGNDVAGYELPAGGGSDSIKAQSVKVQKVIRKKYVINPYSSILFAAPPPIDQVVVNLAEETANQYKVGQGSGETGEGEGTGAGFGSGTGTGKVSFVRLRHGDRGWDRNFGFDGDRNMLAEYHARTKQKAAEETESVEIGQLSRMPAQKAPPLLYICGSQSLPLTASDKKVLKEYLTERHGMILGDNQGGQAFHQHFVAAMNEITGVAAVPIARDDRIHQRPYAIPLLPIVVAHGPPTALGWKIDGRWAVYYHPGALSDAWRSDHAGIKKDVWESCYQLGVNVIFYSLSEKNKWLQSQKP